MRGLLSELVSLRLLISRRPLEVGILNKKLLGVFSGGAGRGKDIIWNFCDVEKVNETTQADFGLKTIIELPRREKEAGN